MTASMNLFFILVWAGGMTADWEENRGVFARLVWPLNLGERLYNFTKQ